jgi:predicted DNA-binding transcriptional regulator AlpA
VLYRAVHREHLNNIKIVKYGYLKMIERTNTQDKLLSAKALGKILSLSSRQIFLLNKNYKIPAPIRIGGSVRWEQSVIIRWLSLGAPDRKTFEAIEEVER